MNSSYEKVRYIDDIDVIETNEAFASPVLAQCVEFEIDFNDPRINPTGGAIAIGHFNAYIV